MTKKLLLFTAIFSFVVSCTDYEDDFANLNDQLDGISSQLDGIESAVEGIAAIQLEILNINSALDAISTSIGELPTVDDISNLAALINGAIAQLTDLDGDLAALSSQVTAQMSALTDLINNGFSAVDAYLDLIDADIAVIDGVVTDNNNALTAQQLEIAQILADLGVIQVELDNIDGDNAAILTQLASMLTAINDNFADLSADNQEILADIAGVQAELASQLLIIQALETAISDLQDSVDVHDASVEAQIDALEALITALQEDITVLLESTTTVYNDDLEIKNDAQLEYALSLDDKVMVINGYVDVDTNFAGTDASKLAEIDSVMSKMNTVTGDVTIQSTADLKADKLRSIGGDYSVSGFDITDTALANVAGNATYNYTSDSYNEPNLENIGGSLTITDNGSATVDFSNLESIGALSNFSIKDSGGIVTNTLTDATTVKLGSAILDSKLTTPGLIVAYNAAVTTDIIVDVLTTMTVTGGQAVTGGIDITCENLTATFADVTATDVSIESDGLVLTVANVQADDIIIIDNGATANSSLTYTSVTADMFDFTAADGMLNIATDEDANSNWTVLETDIMSEGSVTWSHVIPAVVGTSCAVALPITGNIDIFSTSGSVDFDFGWMVGALNIDAELYATVTSYQAASSDVNDWDADGDITEAWYAVEGNVTVKSDTDAVELSNKICDVATTPTYVYDGIVLGNVDIASGTDVFVGSALLLGTLDITGFGAGSTVSFSTDIQIDGPVNASGAGTFDGSNWDFDGYPVAGDVTITAGEGIDLSQAIELGTGQNSNLYVTTLASDGPINLSAVASTSNDVAISGAGNVDLSALDNAAGTLSIAASTVNLDSFVSSTGDVVIDAQLNNDALPLLEEFTSLSVDTETVVNLGSYVSGTITLGAATTFSSTSVATADLTADVLENYTLAAQVVDLTITGADLPALLSLDVTTADVAPAVGIDLISVTGTTATSITTAGNADVFVVSDNPDLTTINALHQKGDDPNGTKVHILNNTSLTGYVSNTKSMLEIRIEGNTSLTTLDLSSYLDVNGAATYDDTASDYAPANYILRVTGNGILGTYVPIDNNGNSPTDLDSAELATAKTIALHLLSLQQPQSVVAEADFVDLVSDPNAVNIGDNNTDFTDGINTIEEWTILNTP